MKALLFTLWSPSNFGSLLNRGRFQPENDRHLSSHLQPKYLYLSGGVSSRLRPSQSPGAVFAGEGILVGLKAYRWLAASSGIGCACMRLGFHGSSGDRLEGVGGLLLAEPEDWSHRVRQAAIDHDSI